MRRRSVEVLLPLIICLLAAVGVYSQQEVGLNNDISGTNSVTGAGLNNDLSIGNDNASAVTDTSVRFIAAYALP